MNKIKFNKKGSTFFILFAYLVLSITILGFTYDLCRVMYYKVTLKNTASVVALSITNRCHYLSSSTINTNTLDPSGNLTNQISVIIMEDPLQAEFGSSQRTDMEIYRDYVSQLENNQLPYYSNVGSYAVSNGYFVNVDKSEITLDKNSFDSNSSGKVTNITNSVLNRNFNIVYASHEYLEQLLKAQKENGFNSKLSLSKIYNRNPSDSNWDGKDFIISLNESDINRELSTSNQGITPAMISAYQQVYSSSEVNAVYDNLGRLNRFVNGKDGKNGEVEVYLVGYVKYFFLGNGLFSSMQPYTRIYTVVMAQPQVYTENLSLVDNNTSSGSTIYRK